MLTRTTSCLGLIVAILVLVSTAYAAPPGRVVRVGLLYPISPNFDPATNRFDRELVEGLRELGYTPGRDVVFEFRSAASGGQNCCRSSPRSSWPPRSTCW